MKILFVTNYPSPYRVDFFNELGKVCDVTVAFEERPGEQENRDINWFKDEYTYFKAVFLKKTRVRKAFICLDVKEYVCDESYDLVIITNYSTPTEMYAIHCMKKRGIKFAIEIDGGIAKSGKGFVEKLKKKLMSSAHWWLSTSDSSDAYLMAYGADKSRIHRYPFTSLKERDIIPKVLNKDEKKSLRKELGIVEEKMILTVGQFIPRKGFDILIKSMEKLPHQYGVYIVGGVPTEEYLNLREELKLSNIHFDGFKSKEELKKYYMAADLFVLPTREDIWGLVINEAMAFGLPVVTTDRCVAGLELIKERENGAIVKVEDINGLGEAIDSILSNEELLKKMSENNLRDIKKYTIENMARVHHKLFKEFK